MEPVDPILDHQQEQLRLQQSEQLRRQQLEQQRRQQQDVQVLQQREDKELLELEEDEQELLRRERAGSEAAQPGSADLKPASGMAALMGLLRRKRKAVADPDSDDAAETDGEAHDVASTISSAGGGSGGLWAVGLVVVALGAFAAYQYGSGFFGHAKPTAQAVGPAKTSVDLPLAAPDEGLSSPTGASSAAHTATASVLGSAESAAPSADKPIVAAAPVDPSSAATTVTLVPASPLADPAAAAAAEVANARPTAPAAITPPTELSRLAEGHAKSGGSQDSPSLDLRVRLLEVQLSNLRQELNRLVDEKTAKPAPPVQQARVASAAPRRSGVSRRLARTAARPAIRAATVAPAAPSPAPELQARLLSVDSWDGRPSVVVASGTQTRILQPGDSLNGITLKHADPVSGRATFTTGTGQVTLDVNEGKPSR